MGSPNSWTWRDRPASGDDPVFEVMPGLLRIHLAEGLQTALAILRIGEGVIRLIAHRYREHFVHRHLEYSEVLFRAPLQPSFDVVPEPVSQVRHPRALSVQRFTLKQRRVRTFTLSDVLIDHKLLDALPRLIERGLRNFVAVACI
jgi:hypothetical protein